MNTCIYKQLVNNYSGCSCTLKCSVGNAEHRTKLCCHCNEFDAFHSKFLISCTWMSSRSVF